MYEPPTRIGRTSELAAVAGGAPARGSPPRAPARRNRRARSGRAERGEFAREIARVALGVRDPGVDPGGVVAIALDELRRQARDERVELLGGVEVTPHLEVHRDVALAEDLRQVAGRRASEELELEQ